MKSLKFISYNNIYTKSNNFYRISFQQYCKKNTLITSNQIKNYKMFEHLINSLHNIYVIIHVFNVHKK